MADEAPDEGVTGRDSWRAGADGHGRRGAGAAGLDADGSRADQPAATETPAGGQDLRGAGAAAPDTDESRADGRAGDGSRADRPATAEAPANQPAATETPAGGQDLRGAGAAAPDAGGSPVAGHAGAETRAAGPGTAGARAVRHDVAAADIRVDASAVLIGLARALRAAGVDAGPDRVQAFLGALDALDPGVRADVYWAGRLTLCGSRDDLERYERVFAAYFGATAEGTVAVRPAPLPRLRMVERDAGPVPRARTRGEDDVAPTPALASPTEVLRHRDVAELTAAEREQLRRLLAAFTLRGEVRRTARRHPAQRGAVDPGRTVRELLRRGGEPARLRRHARAERPRRVVLLVDVSGSMAPYADALLRFAHAAMHGARTEVFTIGTRLTRVTRELTHRDPDLALAALAAAVPDWRGGTRLGEMLRDFLDRWGQRGMARGAVVVLLSDGWERGDPALLGEQMRRLHRLAHRVISANPRKARPGYAPLAAGMAAALPSVDAFVEGHSLAALERLAAVVRGAET